ncbi:MAG TPA: hypothetical protein VM618_03880 [Acidimicrobiia bacterium]|nr:hypothetical protein [Acidimicrobiia bacterium]
MTDAARRRSLTAGAATAMGSLPHRDPLEAARLALAATPRLPASPQLPNRSAHEGMLVQWLRALPEVVVAPDGAGFELDGDRIGEPSPELDGEAHGGFLAFVDEAAAQAEPPSAVKTQLTGPLTLGMALADAGMPAPIAFERAAALVEGWAEVVTGHLDRRLSNTQPVVFLDEPALTAWQVGEGPIAREEAVDLLSSVLAGIDAVVGVHVCGDGDRRMAIEAGPEIVGVVAGPDVLPDAIAIGRYLDGGGWVAWGAVPTDRPVGDHAEHWWKALVGVWCELTVAGCDPVLLRQQSLITPACGLAGHGEEQAARVLDLAVEIGERVREQAVATRLSVGA